MRRIFEIPTFARWSRKATVSDAALCKVVVEMSNGLIDAKLGGNVYKKRIPLRGRGKRGGARVLVGTNLGDRWFFLYGFEKNERATIEDRELAALQRMTTVLLATEPKLLELALAGGELIEICHEEKPHPE